MFVRLKDPKGGFISSKLRIWPLLGPAGRAAENKNRKALRSIDDDEEENKLKHSLLFIPY